MAMLHSFSASVITTPTPIGTIGAFWQGAGIRAIFLGDSEQQVHMDIARCFPAEILKPLPNPELERMLLGLVSGETMAGDLPLVIEGSAFQRRVWDALCRIPRGSTITYGELAVDLGLGPTANRAVAGGCASNLHAIAIPCHRVVRADGGLGGYRGGIERKKMLLELEWNQSGSPFRTPDRASA
jgi:O-6-methylguanine DNA methyltransferase